MQTSQSSGRYTFLLEGLDDGEKYFFRINPLDSVGFEYEGTVLDFKTLPRPRVSNIAVQEVPEVAEPSVDVFWESNTAITSILEYFPLSDPSDTRAEVDLEYINGERVLRLTGLDPNTEYGLYVKGSDVVGNETSSDLITFITADDTRPPKIINLLIEGDIAGNVEDRSRSAQLIISWETDEPATSQVEYGIGTAGPYSFSSPRDNTLKTNHLVVISNLNTSEVYHLRVVSQDIAENSGESVDTVAITPKSSDSALELVLNNLAQIFGFLGN